MQSGTVSVVWCFFRILLLSQLCLVGVLGVDFHLYDCVLYSCGLKRGMVNIIIKSVQGSNEGTKSSVIANNCVQTLLLVSLSDNYICSLSL